MQAQTRFWPYSYRGLLIIEPIQQSPARCTYTAQLTAEQELMTDSQLIALADGGGYNWGGTVTRRDVDGMVIEATITVHTD
jgi:hypothetical protein